MKKESLANIMILFGIVSADRIAKYYLNDGCLGVFCIKKAFNTGASFGIFLGLTPLFIAAAIAVLALMAFYYRKVGKTLRLSFAFIGAGTLGNLIDRIFLGGVIDLFSILHSSSFNIADLSNLVGGIILIYALFGKRKKACKKAR